MVCNLEAVTVRVPPCNTWFQILANVSNCRAFSQRHPYIHYVLLNSPCPLLIQLSLSWTPLRNSDSMEVCISPLQLVPCKYHANRIMTDCGSSRYMHIHTLVQLAEMFRREELTCIARGALKKKWIFLHFRNDAVEKEGKLQWNMPMRNLC